MIVVDDVLIQMENFHQLKFQYEQNELDHQKDYQ